MTAAIRSGVCAAYVPGYMAHYGGLPADAVQFRDRVCRGAGRTPAGPAWAVFIAFWRTGPGGAHGGSGPHPRVAPRPDGPRLRAFRARRSPPAPAQVAP